MSHDTSEFLGLSTIRLTSDEVIEMGRKEAEKKLRNKEIKCRGFLGECIPECVWPFCEEKRLESEHK